MTNNPTLKRSLSVKGIDQLQLLGLQDRNLLAITEKIPVKIVARGHDLLLTGSSSAVENAEKILSELIAIISDGREIQEADLKTIVDLVCTNRAFSQASNGGDEVVLYKKDGFIKSRNNGQRSLFLASQENDVVFTIGPAGTGKTFMAVAIAVAALRDRIVDRIVLTRPAVEAGERLGYLPGDFREKIDPYLRPLYDALNDMIPVDKLKKYMESGIVEIVPLAFMRGRTLNNAFAILDEAQNTTFKQMKMFLTRLGVSSKAIITGDVTQIDIPDAESSGLIQVQSILQDIKGIEFVHMTQQDVVRHKLVRDIINAYDTYRGNNDRGRNISGATPC